MNTNDTPKILGISGKKQSGKNTKANYIHGNILRNLGLAKDFYIDESGSLIILTLNKDGDKGWGEFDVTRKDAEFVEYAQYNLWPHVKMYSFADGLKGLCVEFFGLKPEQVYGTDAQKNTTTEIKSPETGELMTAREFMQYFGTDVMRQLHEPVHVNHAISKILSEQSELSIIPDVRFPNEVEAIQNAGGKVIRLTRSTRNDEHASECALDEGEFDWANFDAIIDNDCPMEEALVRFGDTYNNLFLL